jgi:dsDNA-specific endonuclease/ATPase MutS2
MDARAAELDTRAAQIEQSLQNLQNLEALQNSLQAREKSLDSAARERARAYLLEARKTVEAALGQARAAVDEATAKEARRMVEEAIEKTAGRPDGQTAGASDLKVGDRVRTGQGKVGVVAEVRSDGRVVVEVGAVRLVIAPELLVRS